MKLVEIRKVAGKIILKTGLHIGSGNMEMHIGGTDNPVIVHPHTREPYIPGSSLKGKTRALLEMKSGLMGLTDGHVLTPRILSRIANESQKKEAMGILKVFGSSPGEGEEGFEQIGPTRVSFSDAYLHEDWKKKAEQNQWIPIEVKSENSIDRIKGTAENPRFTERVPSGAEFHLLIAFKIFDGDANLFDDVLLAGLKLLELDALGGSTSRGYGRIELKLDDPELQEKFEAKSPFVVAVG